MKPQNELLSQLKGQYVFTAEDQNCPEGWTARSYNEWKLFTNQLPVADVYDEAGRWLGWCLGYPILDGVLNPEKIILKSPTDQYDPYSDFYERTSGQWVLILPAVTTPSVYLDPSASLPAVYSTLEKTLATTPTLVGTENDWDEQLMAEVGYPEKIYWIPSGLTFKKNVRRLLANHSLNLSAWSVSRHWPIPDTDLSIDFDTDAAVSKITNNMQSTLSAVAKQFPLCITLTAGMDSRMALASARNYIQNAEIITFANKDKETVDMVIAALIAKQENLNHKFLMTKRATPEELEQWQYVTGRCVAGGIWKIHKTITQVDPSRVLLTGQSGEVHKGSYWRSSDTATSNLSAADVLKRCKLPLHPVLLKATEEWLAGVSHFNNFIKLDLIKLEQRMSSWAALQAVGNTTSAFEVAPSGSRLIFRTMMKLPHSYRLKHQLPYDICKKLWPELLKFPFNQHPGLKGYYDAKVKSLKKFVKRLIGR